MPRYTAVAPTFTPLDYKTRIAPLEQYKEEYDKRMDALDEQGVLADAIGGLIDPNDERDAELTRVYGDFSDKMNNTAKELLQTGDLGSSRRALGELRRDYANKLVPIQQAYNSRAEAGKAWRDAKLKDKSLIGTDPLEHSLSDYMHGNIPNDKTVSGMELYALGQADAKAASGREFREAAWRLDKNLGNQFFSRVQQEGWSQDEVVQALSHYANSSDEAISKDAQKLLDYMVNAKNRIGSMSGIAELQDANKIAQADNYILEGIISGIGYKQTDDQKAYDPSFWVDAKLKERQLNGTDGPQQLVPSFDTVGLVNINGSLENLVGVAQLLSDISTRKVSLNDTTGRVIKDGQVVESAKHGAYMGMPMVTDRYETYGDKLWELAKSVGEVTNGKSKESFLNEIRNASQEQFEQKMRSIEGMVRRNAQLYREARGKITDTKYFTQHVNEANDTYYTDNGKLKERGSVGLITNSKGEPVQHVPYNGNYILPVRRDERKGIKYVSGTGRDTRVHYISPDTFQNTVIFDGGDDLSMRQAINRYYTTLEIGDGEHAAKLMGKIMDALASYTSDRLQIEGATNSAMNTVVK